MLIVVAKTADCMDMIMIGRSLHHQICTQAKDGVQLFLLHVYLRVFDVK